MSRTPQLPLPIDPLLPELVEAMGRASGLVLQAAPGAGKTTRVPRALLEAGIAGGKEIVVLQPRRLATRLAAERVADELGEKVGEAVGYQVRFEDVSSAKTRLRFVTEGVLGRRLLSDPALENVGLVALDEFHERHLAGDLSLALLRRLQETTRPDLKIAVMSATLDADPVAAFLGGAPIFHSEGRRFEVTVAHLATPDERPLHEQVLAALKRALQADVQGHVLVFLPGAGEIRRAAETVADFAGRHGLEVLPLHGDLPFAEQERAVRPSARRKLILSTNVSETSVTIEGVGLVIDSGLARVASHSPWSGMPVLKLAKVSKASAIQRAGRAGRTREGACYRLYTRHDFEGRPAHDVPELRRADLAETVLALRAMGVRDLAGFPFFEAPPPAALDSADALLDQLGASKDGALTGVGKKMLSLPVHPRLARVLVEAEGRGVGARGAIVAALLGERELRREHRALGGSRKLAATGRSDLLELVELFEEASRARFNAGKLNGLGLDTGAVHAVERVRSQLSRRLSRRPETGSEDDLLLSVLAGYPDRVARRRKAHAPEVVLSSGGSATLAETSVVREAPLLIAVDAEERANGQIQVRLASEVDPLWLLDLYPERLTETDARVWNPQTQKVERLTRMAYGAISLEETRAPAEPGPETSRVLAAEALAAGLERFVDPEALAAWIARVETIAQAYPEAGLPAPDDAFLRATLERACEGLRSFAELRELSLISLLEAQLAPAQQRLLQTKTPERVTLPGGRSTKVRYARGQPPWIESRLQDFFGMAQGPSVCDGRVALVLHLLAPNHRAVQVTTDLAGFWERHYPSIRKELMRRYPRHAWPEDPRHATPPSPRR